MSKELTTNDSNRAAFVLSQLVKIINDTKTNFFTICEFLLEACEGNYHKHFGCNSFSEWIEQANLDMSTRQAYYYLSIAKKTRELGISKDSISELPISKLKEILSLEPATHADTIKGLIAEADSLPMEQIKAKVRSCKTNAGEEIYCHYNFKLPELVKETVDELFEFIRQMYGSIVNEETGEITDISGSKCLELLCVTVLQNKEQFFDLMPKQEGVVEVS